MGNSNKMMKGVIVCLVAMAAIVHAQGWSQNKHNTQRKPQSLGKSLKYFAFYVRQVIKKYKKQHLIWVKYKNIPLKKNLAFACKQKARKEKLSVKDRANEILKILQLFVNDLQQIQVDESRLPKGSYEITKALRHLEYDLRDITESAFRGMVKKNLRLVTVPYSVGSLPNSSSRYCCRAKTVRSVNVLQLHMLLSCIGDIYHATNNDLYHLLHETNSTKGKIHGF